MARGRLDFHLSVLERFGIRSLNSLGTFNLSGAIAARPGVVIPPGNLSVAPSLIQVVPLGILRPQEVPRRGRTVPMGPGFVEAKVLPLLELPTPARVSAGTLSRALPGQSLRSVAFAQAAREVLLNVAYFAAQTLVLADNTTVVLQYPHQYLTLIAEKIIVGQNVTFTYERPNPASAVESYPPGSKPGKPAQPPAPEESVGTPGTQGTSGRHGGIGWAGTSAPEIELWTLDLQGSPRFDLTGQDGGDGGRGEDGGDGGDGSDGRSEAYDFLGFCARAAGGGGDGGPGGNSGNGGRGGPGGRGGRLSIYAPEPVLIRYASGGFNINTQGGDGGRGGAGGTPGAGGQGGRLGPHPKRCVPSEDRFDGRSGPMGQPGAPGSDGSHGDQHPRPVQFVPISEDEFQLKLTDPALISAAPSQAIAGTTVTVNALRLANDDNLVLDGVLLPATMLADTLLTFTVPAVRGGSRALQIVRSNGRRSNLLSFYVLPQVSAVGTGGRISPGSWVTVTGSGFAEGARVRINGEDMADTTFVNASTLNFTLRRPTNTADNPDGELGLLRVILADGTSSNEVSFTIDTLRILVLGDSVAWGQGLREQEKYSTLVAATLAARNGGIKSYTSMLAHSGATIGAGDSTVLPAVAGEVPTSYPTALQQLDSYTGAPDAVDLVMITAGINDVNIRTVVNPLNTPSDFTSAIEQYSHKDLRALLSQVVARFPNATIVTTGYYPILSDESDLLLVSAFLVAVGISIASLPGGVLSTLLVPKIATNCRAFHEQSTIAIQAAIDDVNDMLPSPRILFADPGFTASNAALASTPFVFGINADLSPQDGVAGERGGQCDLNSDRADGFQCKRASIGHPNPTGARAYADAIIAALDRGFVDESAGLPPFPPNFLWGVATSATQNEGDITNNDWAVFTDSPAIRERVRKLSATGGNPITLVSPGEALGHSDLAVLGADLDQATQLGINTFRFSVEWARIQPAPAAHPDALTDADVNLDAVTYYDRLLDTLESQGNITPVISLNHLSLPDWVLTPPRDSTILSAVGLPTASGEDADFKRSLRGWENEATVAAYLEFVRYLVTRWKDRVRWWLTVNEPVGSMVGLGYIAGIWPPGFTGDGARAKAAHFNLIRAHARAYELIKSINADAMVGFAHAMLHAKVTTTASDTLLGDQEAARNQFDYFYNWHFLDAVINGQVDMAIHRRPQNRNYLQGQALADFFGFAIDEENPWRSHCDFIGLNYYRSVYVFADALVSLSAGFSGGRFENNLRTSRQPHQILNDLGWEVSPGGFGELLHQLHERYQLPILITENGIPQAIDKHRGPYIIAHLEQLLRAIADGVDVRGYLYWTLADNWELQEGYRPEARFGLLTVNRDDAARPRSLTPGAEALQYIISRGNLAGAAEVFGTITPQGDRVRPPLRSPAFFTGTLGKEPITLWLHSDPAGGISGGMQQMMQGTRRLHTIVGAVSPEAGSLVLMSREPEGTPELMLTGRWQKQDGSLVLTGESETETPWTLTQDPLMGDWLGAEPFPRLRLMRTPGKPDEWMGLWLPDELPRAWQPLAVTVDGMEVTLEGPGRRFRGRRQGDQLVGEWTNFLFGGSSPWSARRVTDDLGL